MMRWFCLACRRAGTVADAVCCDRALVVASRADELAWLRLRMAAKPLHVLAAITALACDGWLMRCVLARNARERGGEWRHGR
jgi:hypothetical protein